MERAIVVRGRLTDAQHIELDEPVTELEGPGRERDRTQRVRGVAGGIALHPGLLRLRQRGKGKELVRVGHRGEDAAAGAQTSDEQRQRQGTNAGSLH